MGPATTVGCTEGGAHSALHASGLPRSGSAASCDTDVIQLQQEAIIVSQPPVATRNLSLIVANSIGDRDSSAAYAPLDKSNLGI